MTKPTLSTRAAGILLHPTSLPSAFGAGDLGPQAYRFADALRRAGMRWWQMLPTTPPGPGPEFSPYSSQSAFAGSPWLLSPQMLFQDGLLSKRDLAKARRPLGGRIDFPRLHQSRSALLRTAFTNSAKLSQKFRRQLDHFNRENANWLDDYSLYAALKENRPEKSWLRWPAELRRCLPSALAAAKRELADAIAFQRFIQWLFDRQWTALKDYCNRLGIGLIGDIPIFVARESAAVWARKDLFLLDSHGNPTVVSGYPPDPFSRHGQLWGHPHYRWPAHVAEGFAWWISRFERLLRQFDAVRVDHFLGFHRVWAVPAGSKDAVHGKWIKTPGVALFAALRARLGEIPIIAEDLGEQTPQALALRDKYNFPGMRILQFAFGDCDYNCPHAFPRNSVVYTGTHDNQTIVGWLKDLQASHNGELARALTYVGGSPVPSHWDFIRILFASVAQIVVIPVQDVLGLGAEHRMNIPGILHGNWGWRMSAPLPQDTIRHLRALADVTGRYKPEETQTHVQHRNRKKKPRTKAL